MELNKWGYIVADEETGRTSNPKIWAGGDIVTGAATVILAMGAGQAVMATTTLAFAGNALMLLVTWGTFFALALFGIAAALLNLRLRSR